MIYLPVLKYYQLDPGRNMGKTNSLNDKDLQSFVKLQKTRPETEQSWNIKVGGVSSRGVENFDLSVKNPNTPEEAPLRSPEIILAEMEKLDAETNSILKTVKELI